MRYIIKILICRVLFYSGLLDVYIRFLLRRRKDFPAVIINYHSFVDRLDSAMELDPCVTHRIDEFKREVKFLRKYFEISSLDSVADHLKNGKKFVKPTIAITIDDGYRDNYDVLFPVIQEHHVPVTIFLTSGLIGTDQRIWVNRLGDIFYATKRTMLDLQGAFNTGRLFLNTLDQRRHAYKTVLRQLKDAPMETREECLKRVELELGKGQTESSQMLNWEQIAEMAKGNVTFGAHTCFHPILTNMPVEAAKKEIAASKTIIENKLGVKAKHFAYPNGRPRDFNEDLRAYCRELGFESVSSCDYGNNSASQDVFSLKRIGASSPLPLFAVNVVRAFGY